MADVKPKFYEFKDIPTLFPDLGNGQGARGGNKSHWDRSLIVADMLTIGGYSPTEGPIVAFQDELDGKIAGAERAPADGNLRALAIADILDLVEKDKVGKDALHWKVPVLIYPAGLDMEERERIRNRARDTTQTKTKHDYYCWGLKFALKNMTMGDTDLCRNIGPGPIRSQWADAVVAGSTFRDEKGVERFKPNLPLDSKDGQAMLVNKQGPIQEITRVRSLPAFAREFFLLHPSERLNKTFTSSRNWSQAWSQDLRARGDLTDVKSLSDLLTRYPESKLGALVAVHAASGKVERNAARGDGKGAYTAAERERVITTFDQHQTFMGEIVAVVIKMIGRGHPGYTGVEVLEMLESLEPHVTPDAKAVKILSDFKANAAKLQQDATAQATADEQTAASAKAKAEAAAIKKAKKGT